MISKEEISDALEVVPSQLEVDFSTRVRTKGAAEAISFRRSQ